MAAIIRGPLSFQLFSESTGALPSSRILRQEPNDWWRQLLSGSARPEPGDTNGPRPPRRTWWWPPATALLIFAALIGTDLAVDRCRFEAGSLLARPVFQGFKVRARRGPGLAGREGARISVGGLRAGSSLLVQLELAGFGARRRVRLLANGMPAGTAALGPDPAPVRLTVTSPDDGRVILRFAGARGRGFGVRVLGLEVSSAGAPRGRVPRQRLVLHAVLAVLAVAFAWRTTRRPRLRLAAPLVGAGVLCAAVVANRCATLPALPWLALSLAFPVAWLLLSDLLAAAARMSLSSSRWIAAAMLLRLGLVLIPGFDPIDVTFHVHRAWLFQAKGLVMSDAPGLSRVPYPPALYVVLGPFLTGEVHHDETVFRLAMGAMEALSPLLVLGLLRAGGASAAAAEAGAVTCAVMPEGTLVLAKGIACNIFGSFTGLLLVWALLRRVSAVTLAALLVLVALSHAPAAFTTISLVSLWWLMGLGRGDLARREFGRNLACLAVALGVAWVVYYRETALVAGAGAWMQLRWYRVGKAAQDLLLKFGLVPVIWSWQAMAARRVPEALRGLLTAWFTVGIGLLALALVTPLTLRFEYFLVPAVAMAAGTQIAAAVGRRVAWSAWAMALLLQSALGLLYAFGRLQIISVIMESPNWPFPVRLH